MIPIKLRAMRRQDLLDGADLVNAGGAVRRYLERNAGDMPAMFDGLVEEAPRLIGPVT